MSLTASMILALVALIAFVISLFPAVDARIIAVGGILLSIAVLMIGR
jgi:hypothetical protein